jgi:hypothetical protein
MPAYIHHPPSTCLLVLSRTCTALQAHKLAPAPSSTLSSSQQPPPCTSTPNLSATRSTWCCAALTPHLLPATHPPLQPGEPNFYGGGEETTEVRDLGGWNDLKFELHTRSVICREWGELLPQGQHG